MKWQQLILVFIASISLIFAGNALAQTDININNTNLIRFGGSVTVPENQVVENALAFGGSVTVLPNARVLDTAIALILFAIAEMALFVAIARLEKSRTIAPIN